MKWMNSMTINYIEILFAVKLRNLQYLKCNERIIWTEFYCTEY